MPVDYAKKAEELEERCKSVPDIPEDFYRWSKNLFTESWLFYKRKGNFAKMFCCNCGNEYTVRIKGRDSFEGQWDKVHPIPEHNTLGKCTECGATVIFKSGATRGDHYEDRKILLIGQKYKENGYVLRNIEVYREYGKDRENTFSYIEKSRSWYLPGKRQVQEDWQKYDYWRSRDYWDYQGLGGLHKQLEHFGYIYPGTYAAMKGTVLEYCMIEEYIQNYYYSKKYTRNWLYNYDLRAYLNTYFRYPIIEALVKMGAYEMVKRLEGTWRFNLMNINNRAKNPYDMLRIKKSRLKDVIREQSSSVLIWAQWERKHEDIDDTTFQWLVQIGHQGFPEQMKEMLEHMSPKQIRNYVMRQQEEQYKGKSEGTVISQYADYYRMCQKAGKKLDDAMVYRPKELKRRHDEMVAEIERLQAQIKADEYSKKFSEAEKVLGNIREKFEYVGDGFFIKVPEKIVDIVSEGNYLHHCAGATDRYFDRIKQNETYICFLRKIEEPDIPFYTIEVEPGGTIRQHRGMYDEEPELDKVKPFLKEWQQEIRKRMSKKDHELAAVSKEKREANIADLRAKNNTRVLQGLMEDFMEAI